MTLSEEECDALARGAQEAGLPIECYIIALHRAHADGLVASSDLRRRAERIGEEPPPEAPAEARRLLLSVGAEWDALDEASGNGKCCAACGESVARDMAACPRCGEAV